MNNHVLVGKMNGAANRQEELNAFPQIELVVVAIMIEGLAVDVFHHEVRQSSIRRPGIEQSGNIVMVAQSGQNLNLITKARMISSVSMPRLRTFTATCC
jgi:hypothetical protein